MEDLKKFRVILKFETDGPAEKDLEIEKVVMASTRKEARDKALDLVKLENPEVNYAAKWFDSTVELFD